MSIWKVEREGGCVFAECDVLGITTYDICIDEIARSSNPSIHYEHIGDKTWASQAHVDELKNIVEKFNRGAL